MCKNFDNFVEYNLKQSNRIFSKRINFGDFIFYHVNHAKTYKAFAKNPLLLIEMWCNRNDLLKNPYLFRFSSPHAVRKNL